MTEIILGASDPDRQRSQPPVSRRKKGPPSDNALAQQANAEDGFRNNITEPGAKKPLDEYVNVQEATHPTGKKFKAVYTYTETDGEAVRHKGRSFNPGGKPYSQWGKDTMAKLPYHLHLLRDANTVYVTEGEKDALALEWAGFHATTAGGAGLWDDDYSKALQDALTEPEFCTIVVWSDNDEEGRKDQAKKVASLRKFFPEDALRVVEAAAGKDAYDHLSARLSLAQAVPVALVAPAQAVPATEVVEVDVTNKTLWTLFGMALDRVTSGAGRNETAHWLGQQLRDHDLSEELALEVFAPRFVEGVPQDPPFSLQEVVDAFKSAYRQDKRDRALVDADSKDDEEYERQARRRRIARLLDEEESARDFIPPPSTGNMTKRLLEDIPETVFVIEGMHAQGSNTLLSAATGVGKTTILLNLWKSLIDGDPFLGRFRTMKAEGGVAFWNYEVNESMFINWFRDLRFVDTDRAWDCQLREHRVPLLTPQGRKWAVEWLKSREVTAWIIDPYARAFGGETNDNKANNDFLEALDEIKGQAGVVDLFVADHFGHNGTHTIGASRKEAWCDHLWKLTRDKQATTQLVAEKRDTDLCVDLDYDKSSRLYTVNGETQTKAVAIKRTDDTKLKRILQEVQRHPDILKSKIKSNIKLHNRDTHILDRAEREGLLNVEQKGNSQHCTITAEGEKYLQSGQIVVLNGRR